MAHVFMTHDNSAEPSPVDIDGVTNFSVDIEFEGRKVHIWFVDERPDMELDPTLLVFLDDDEEPYLKVRRPGVDEAGIIIDTVEVN